jgi:hypothetical protein
VAESHRIFVANVELRDFPSGAGGAQRKNRYDFSFRREFSRQLKAKKVLRRKNHPAVRMKIANER